ncbi:histidine phosphatase family protein [Sulfitobacter sp. F26169L]|uniref:SixA phosphatase family protein n=1 Tax=Sulfitobacter sp. F26169L TaxID=2996015 RepID=UPI002260ECAF|nr:histidine phosphatase family protein [Sulfitobacter sp. F26169L]MCX7566848.1 histidine phosphatase family protein [Sulfitobacter sp. F26169L]
MKRLILMRHAKSDWSDLNASDHARTLNQRGQRSADAMGNWLREHDFLPDQVLCSDAARTRETLSRLSLGEIPTAFMRELYLAEPDVMAATLHAHSADCVLMIGHNPGIAMLADQLLANAPAHPQFYSYPTCATLVADFDISRWDALRHGCGQVVEFSVPRDLMD